MVAHCAQLPETFILVALPDAAQLTAEQLRDQLKALCYANAAARERSVIGCWSAECTELMRLNPKHLLLFDELRNEGVGRALGGARYIINPIAACCPGCGQVFQLSVANGLGFLLQHVETCNGHSSVLAKRLRLALEERLVTAAQLDAD